MKSGKQAKYYQNKGIKCVVGDIFKINISLLSNGSHVMIKIKCDNCNEEKNIEYGKYYSQTSGCTDNYYCKKCCYLKQKKTKKERYGNENYNNSKSYKETCLKMYGVDNYSKTDDCKKNVKKIKLKRYGNENYNNKKKSKLTCLEKYGTEYPLQNDEIKQKGKNTIIKKYGVDSYTKTKEFQEKCKKTCLKKYGVDNYTKTEEFQERYKNTCLEKYGVDNYTKTEEFQERYEDTCLKKYGVIHPLLNDDILHKYHQNLFKKEIYKDINYQGSYELDFLVKFNEDFKIERGKMFKYEYNGKIKRYFPDFYLPKYNLIVEIKSNYIYNLAKDINELKKKSVLKKGFNFIFIIDKNYTDFNKLLSITV